MATSKQQYASRKDLAGGLDVAASSQSAVLAAIPYTTAYSWIPTVAHQLLVKPFMYKGLNQWQKGQEQYTSSSGGNSFANKDMYRDKPIHDKGLSYTPTGVVKDTTKTVNEKNLKVADLAFKVASIGGSAANSIASLASNTASTAASTAPSVVEKAATTANTASSTEKLVMGTEALAKTQDLGVITVPNDVATKTTETALENFSAKPLFEYGVDRPITEAAKPVAPTTSIKENKFNNFFNNLFKNKNIKASTWSSGELSNLSEYGKIGINAIKDTDNAIKDYRQKGNENENQNNENMATQMKLIIHQLDKMSQQGNGVGFNYANNSYLTGKIGS